MSLIVEAIYESGVLKLLAPLPNVKEQERDASKSILVPRLF